MLCALPDGKIISWHNNIYQSNKIQLADMQYVNQYSNNLIQIAQLNIPEQSSYNTYTVSLAHNLSDYPILWVRIVNSKWYQDVGRNSILPYNATYSDAGGVITVTGWSFIIYNFSNGFAISNNTFESSGLTYGSTNNVNGNTLTYQAFYSLNTYIYSTIA